MQELPAVVSWTVWAAFAVDFSVRIALADRAGTRHTCGMVASSPR